MHLRKMTTYYLIIYILYHYILLYFFFFSLSEGGVDPDQSGINLRMNAVKHKIMILSGKGGKVKIRNMHVQKTNIH